MQKWKKALSGILASVMVLECALAANPMQAQAAEGQALPGTVYDIYTAYQDGTETSNAWVDPEFGNDRPGTLNSSLSPRVIELRHQANEADNGKLLATFECNRLPKTDAALVSAKQGNGGNITAELSAFPIYESLDGGRTWGAGDTEKPARGGNYLPVGYVQNQGSENGTVGMRNCPQLYEMPETIGNLQKGTILCAGNSIEAGENGAAANVSQSHKTNLDLCISTDLGRNWSHHSTIVGPFEGYCALHENTVWEPFFLTHGGKLYCFYSDEAFDDTTDQDISYVVYDGTSWSTKRRIIYTAGTRPGMPVVSQLEDGRFMLTYEINGGGSPGSGYILSAANDPTKWYAADGTLKDTANGEYVAYNDAKVVCGNGAPYNITTDKHTVLYNNTSLGQIWVNSSKAPDAEGAFWRYYNTGLGSAYNREILQLSNGNIFLVGGWNNSGIKCVSWDYELDLEKTGYLESKIPFNGASVYLAYNNSPLFVWTGKDGHAEENQYYEFQEISEGVYLIVSTNNGKAVTAVTANAGSQVNTEAKNAADIRQQWVFEEGADGYYRVRNMASDLYLTTPRKEQGDQRDLYLTLEAKDGSDSQLWKPDIAVKTTQEEGDKTRYSVNVLPAEGVNVSAKSSVAEGSDITVLITKRQGCKSIDQVLVNGQAQALASGDNGSASITIENVQGDITIAIQTTLDDWYVSVPTNDHHGRNQCLSPRVVEALDGTLYCTFESAIASKEANGEFVFPIYESKDKGKTWEKVGEVVNDDTVHPDEFYKVTYKNGVPDQGEQVEEGTEGAIRHPWSMHNCPQLFVLPEAMGDLPKGALLCAGDAVPIEENPKQVSDAGYGGLWKTSLDMYYSTDKGRTWKFLNVIADGGRNIMGYTPVWEPFFVYYNQELICYYSDETDSSHAQKLVHKIMKDGKTWGTAVDDVAFGNRNARPGMPIVTQMENGKWMMVYEGVGTSNPIKSFFKIADDPYQWNPTDPGRALPGVNNVYGGSPYVYTLQDGRVVAGTGSISEVLINTKKDGTGAWLPYQTGAIDGYNRCYLQLSTGEFLINGSKGFDKQNNYIYVKSLDVAKDLKESEALKSLYYITNQSNSEVLGIWEGSTANGAKGSTWENEIDSTNQMWTPVPMEDGSYILKNYASGRLLSLQEDGSLVQLNAVAEAGDAQKRQCWIPVKAEGGSYLLQNAYSHQYLGAGADHALTITDAAGASTQNWTFEKVGDSTETFTADGTPILPVSYKITYHLDGGANNPANPAEYDGKTAISLKDPAKEGYTFEGWFTESAFANKVAEIASGSTGNLDLYAKWKKNATEPPVDDKIPVSAITLHATAKSLTRGKTFALKATVAPANASNQALTWKSSNEKAATVNKDGVVKAVAGGEAVITASATDGSGAKASCRVTVPYKITYKMNKGTNHKGNPSSYYNQKITLKSPSRKGYAFGGWYSDSKFKKKVTSIAKTSKKDLTLYAKWAKVTVKAPAIQSVKNTAAKKAKVTIRKVSGAKGYRILYSTDKKFKKGVKSVSSNTASKALTKLKKGKTYYVKACAYKLDSTKQKVYGKYGKAKSVKIKK